MVPLLARAVREVFHRERFPTRVLWWFAAEGMAEWFHLLEEELAPFTGGREPARALLAEVAKPLFLRRYKILRRAHGELPQASREPRAVALTMGALYRVASNDGARWLFADLGGAPESLRDHWRAERWLAGVTARERWEEVTCHLGELLIALTDGLPARVPRARGVLGDLCFAAGVRFGQKMKKAFDLAGTPADAIEMLRMSEYVFRVNPQHWGEADSAKHTGWLEGTACPWYEAPGWNGAHCGIFGQFQSGISSTCGLRYHLTTTIPKHGGHLCRIDLRPQPPDVPAVALVRRAGAGGSSRSLEPAPRGAR